MQPSVSEREKILTLAEFQEGTNCTAKRSRTCCPHLRHLDSAIRATMQQSSTTRDSANAWIDRSRLRSLPCCSCSTASARPQLSSRAKLSSHVCIPSFFSAALTRKMTLRNLVRGETTEREKEGCHSGVLSNTRGKRGSGPGRRIAFREFFPPFRFHCVLKHLCNKRKFSPSHLFIPLQK
eukprot:377145-Rhodomonas_salina.1